MEAVEPLALTMAYLPRVYRQPALPTLDELCKGFQATTEENAFYRRSNSEPCVVVNGYLQNVMEARPWDFYPWVEGDGVHGGGFAINLTHGNAATRLFRIGPIRHRRFLQQKQDRPLYFRNGDEAAAFLARCHALSNMPKSKMKAVSPTMEQQMYNFEMYEGDTVC